MQNYRIKETGQIVTEQEYRDLYPNISFSAILTPEDADLITDQPLPTITSYQLLARDKVIFNNSRWEYTWKVLDWSKEKIEVEINRVTTNNRKVFKSDRSKAIENIVVTVNNKSFNGDEVSQNRIARTIVAMQSTNATEQRWTLSDNTSVVVTLTELIEVLSLASQAQTKLWSV